MCDVTTRLLVVIIMRFTTYSYTFRVRAAGSRAWDWTISGDSKRYTVCPIANVNIQAYSRIPGLKLFVRRSGSLVIVRLHDLKQLSNMNGRMLVNISNFKLWCVRRASKTVGHWLLHLTPYR